MEPTPPASSGQAPSISPASPAPVPFPTCPQCHAQVRETYYFCYNCGKNLKPKPLSTSIETLLMYYLGAIVLPPMGIVWGIKYVKEQDQKAKIHGIILIIITIIELIILTVWTMNIIKTINTQVGSQLNGLQGF